MPARVIGLKVGVLPLIAGLLYFFQTGNIDRGFPGDLALVAGLPRCCVLLQDAAIKPPLPFEFQA